MDPFGRLADAATRILMHERELAKARADKAAALVGINEGGWPKRQVAEIAREFLLDNEFSPEEVSRLALSPWAVRLVLDRPRPDPTATAVARGLVS